MFRSSVAGLLVFAAVAAGTVRADDTSVAVVEKLLPGVVMVVADGRVGTAFVADKADRLLVTADHVVAGTKIVTVYFPEVRDGVPVAEVAHYRKGGKGVTAKVVTTDPRKDLAVLRLDTALPTSAQELKLAARVVPGETVYTLGGSRSMNTHFVFHTSDVGAVVRREKAGFSARVVETSLVIDPDGGPAVNAKGEVVGVVFHRVAGAKMKTLTVSASEIATVIERAKAAATAEDRAATPL